MQKSVTSLWVLLTLPVKSSQEETEQSIGRRELKSLLLALFWSNIVLPLGHQPPFWRVGAGREDRVHYLTNVLGVEMF